MPAREAQDSGESTILPVNGGIRFAGGNLIVFERNFRPAK
jgi:hypothetical protein